MQFTDEQLKSLDQLRRAIMMALPALDALLGHEPTLPSKEERRLLKEHRQRHSATQVRTPPRLPR